MAEYKSWRISASLPTTDCPCLYYRQTKYFQSLELTHQPVMQRGNTLLLLSGMAVMHAKLSFAADCKVAVVGPYSTYWDIANANGITTTQLSSFNPGLNCSLLQPGECYLPNIGYSRPFLAFARLTTTFHSMKAKDYAFRLELCQTSHQYPTQMGLVIG